MSLKSHLIKNKGYKKGQSALEYLTTYGWALILLVVVISLIYVLGQSASNAVPTTCIFTYNTYCYDSMVGSSANASYLAFLLSNSQQYPIYAPSLIVNISNGQSIHASCTPNMVLPGGAIFCNATIGKTFSQGQFVSASLFLTDTVCKSENAAICSKIAGQTYKGSLSTHSSVLLSKTPITMSLTAKNYTERKSFLL